MFIKSNSYPDWLISWLQIIDAIRRILYAAEEDPSIVEEAQAMLLNQEKQLNPISEDAEECKFDMAFFQLLSNWTILSDFKWY